MAARRTKFVLMYGGVCSKCGSTEHLEFDHIDRTTKVVIKWSWRESKILEELKKCQLLCEACHKDKTRKECYPERKHGTDTMYRKGKCKCFLCRKAHAKYNLGYRVSPAYLR